MISLPKLLKVNNQNKNEYSIENYTFQDYLDQKQKRVSEQADGILPAKVTSICDIMEDFTEEKPVAVKEKEAEQKQEKAQKQEEDHTHAYIAQAEAEAREKAALLVKEIQEKAEAEAEEILAEARKQAEVLKQHAQDEGFKEGYDEGYAKSITEVKEVAEMQSRQYLEEIRDMVEQVTEEKEEILQKYKRDLRNIAIAIGEKVIQVSLKSSGDVIEKMILSATEKLKTREWAKIYISKSDADIMLRGDRDLVQALSRLSDHVKVVVMENEKPGTCIIELPDEIIDASASTQMENIKEILNSTGI